MHARCRGSTDRDAHCEEGAALPSKLRQLTLRDCTPTPQEAEQSDQAPYDSEGQGK